VRKFLAALLLLSVLHQSAAFAGGGWMLRAADGVAHAVLHWEKSPHHHHDDGTLHAEDTDEASRHLQDDSALNLTGLPASPAIAPFHAAPRLAIATPVPAVPSPFLDAPRRPPRSCT